MGEIIFSILFLIQLIMDTAFYFTCKWAWTLNYYLDSFADNYFADHIAPIFFTVFGIGIYIYCYIIRESIRIPLCHQSQHSCLLIFIYSFIYK